MIIKNYQLNNSNILEYSFYLFYGDNEGFKNEKIEQICQTTKYKKFLYYEREALSDVENFSNSLITNSFFENEKIIIIKNATDKILDVIKNTINRKIDGVIIVLDAVLLDKKSKLRNFFEKKRGISLRTVLSR